MVDCVGCNVGPSVISVTGNLNNKVPVNTVYTARRISGTFSTNSRNAAFNKRPMYYTTTLTRMGRLLSESLTKGTGGINSCFTTGLRGLPRMGRMERRKLLINIRFSSAVSNMSMGRNYFSHRVLVATVKDRVVHVIPPLVMDRRRYSGTFSVVGRAIRSLS